MDEAQQIEQAQAGSSAALTVLIEAHYSSVFAYCYRHTGSKETAQDLTQDTFVHMLQQLGRYTHYGKFQNYLYAIAGNICRDFFKKKRPIYFDVLPEIPDEAPSGHDRLAVRTAIAALPFQDRNAVVLRYYHGCTAKEIAVITATSLPMAKYRLRRKTKGKG